MLNVAVKRPVRAVQTFYVSCSGVGSGAFDIMIKPISASIYVRFRVRYCVFEALKWAVSRAETVLFVLRKKCRCV